MYDRHCKYHFKLDLSKKSSLPSSSTSRLPTSFDDCAHAAVRPTISETKVIFLKWYWMYDHKNKQFFIWFNWEIEFYQFYTLSDLKPHLTTVRILLFNLRTVKLRSILRSDTECMTNIVKTIFQSDSSGKSIYTKFIYFPPQKLIWRRCA